MILISVFMLVGFSEQSVSGKKHFLDAVHAACFRFLLYGDDL